jgi:tripartite-type tricarboxylate transporter receptor subunit TctC
MKARLTELGAEPGTVSGAAFGKFLAEDTAKWSELIRISGVKMD